MDINGLINKLNSKLTDSEKDLFNVFFVQKAHAGIDALQRAKISKIIAIIGIAGTIVSMLLYKTSAALGGIAVILLAIVFGYAVFREQKYTIYLEKTYNLK